ncbi:hypothetical protein PQR34_45755 [Paraburkholderia sediminicola]|uniref:hypothetical protein n=1 Tax=Paraburkholderia sediminicola TaxID=458836 RepID=UPI0038BA2568
MPVELSAIPARRKVHVQPPSRLAWGIGFVVWIAVWVAATLWLWPVGESTHSWHFWAILCELPVVLFAIAYCIPLIWYQFERNSVVCHNVAVNYVNRTTVAYGQEPLLVIGSTYCTALGVSDVARKVIAGRTLLGARAGEGKNGEAVRCTRLPAVQMQGEGPEGSGSAQQAPSVFDRYVAAIDGLLTAIAPVAAHLTDRVPLRLRVCVPDDIDAKSLTGRAEKRARELGVVADDAASVPVQEGLMLLDTWLDQPPGRQSDCYTLVLALQLYEIPPENGGETAVGLLIGGPALTESGAASPIAKLHRPVSGAADSASDVLANAIRWGAAISTRASGRGSRGWPANYTLFSRLRRGHQ